MQHVIDRDQLSAARTANLCQIDTQARGQSARRRHSPHVTCLRRNIVDRGGAGNVFREEVLVARGHPAHHGAGIHRRICLELHQ
jgi:hypothetical protein